MRGVILKETDILKNALNGEMESKPMTTLRILTKYYFGNGDSKEVIEDKLNKYMKVNYKSYSPSKWKDLINQLVKSVEKYKTYKMIDVDEVNITENEWFSITSLNNKQLEKLAFILLVYCKINKIKNPTCDNKINNTFSDIFRECGFRTTNETKLLLNSLYKLNYISIGMSCNSTSIRINYIEENEDNIKFTIDNFENVITYYEEYKNGKKYIECECCKKRIISKTKPKKYCPKCAKEIDRNKAKDRMKIMRNN